MLIMAATAKSATVAMEAPLMPKKGIAVSHQLMTTFTTQAKIILITGIAVLPKPCKIPVLIWCIPKKRMPTLMVWIAPAAPGAL